MRFNEPVFRAVSTGIKASVAVHFLKRGPKMSEREIARELKISHMSVNRAVKELFDVNFLKVTRAGNINLWELNRGSFSEKVLSKVLADMPGAIKPVDELKAVIKSCLKGPGIIMKAVIYGSISKGTEGPGSDIDLLLVVKDKQAVKSAVERLERECLRLFGNPLSAHVLSGNEYGRNKKSDVIREAEKGIEINF